MHSPSITTTQEPSPVYDLVSQLGRFAFSSRFQNQGSEGHSPFLSNFLYFDGFGGSVSGKKPKVGASASLSLTSRGSSSIRRIVTEFNRAIRFHCDKFPIGFASVQTGYGDNNGSDNGVGDNNNVLIEDGGGANDHGIALNGVGAESPKKVLILMSDTGGGHRASAEAIKAAFNEEFGDEYQVSYFGLSEQI